MELKQRREMAREDLWDLTHIFPSDEAWEAALTKARAAVDGIPALAGTLGASADALRAGLDAIYDALAQVERVYLYTSLLKSGDNGDARYQEMFARAMNLYVALDTAAAFMDPEILTIPEETLNAYLATGKLDAYRHTLDNTVRARPHTLTHPEEVLLAKLGDAAQTPDDCFTMLESVDMTFPEITGQDGRPVRLTHGNFNGLRESGDRNVRQAAFEGYFGEFRKYINTWAAMYGGSVKLDGYFADVRRHKSACHRALFASNVPVAVYDELVKAVRRGVPAMERYLDLRRKRLGVEKLEYWDLYCPMVEDVQWDMTVDEAKRLVKAATAPLGEEYGRILDRAFNERWMDLYENRGKTTGAFSCGVYGVHPYVLLNFDGRLDDAFTMAHELGHAMHSYLSDTHQDFPNHDYRILVAEVASTVNEVLLTRYLLNTETDKKRRAHVLNHFLEGFRTTVFRQTLFAEFEREAHDLYQSGQALTAESLSAIYRRLDRDYYPGVAENALQDIEWARIPHFYNAFYVYQYATGFCSAVAIAGHILETGDAADYLRFLSTGGSMYPLEELKIAGVDLTKPDTVDHALEVFAQTLDELERLLAD